MESHLAKPVTVPVKLVLDQPIPTVFHVIQLPTEFLIRLTILVIASRGTLKIHLLMPVRFVTTHAMSAQEPQVMIVLIAIPLILSELLPTVNANVIRVISMTLRTKYVEFATLPAKLAVVTCQVTVLRVKVAKIDSLMNLVSARAKMGSLITERLPAPLVMYLAKRALTLLLITFALLAIPLRIEYLIPRQVNAPVPRDILTQE